MGQPRLTHAASATLNRLVLNHAEDRNRAFNHRRPWIERPGRRLTLSCAERFYLLEAILLVPTFRQNA